MMDFNYVPSDKSGLPFISYSNFHSNPFYLRTLSTLVGVDAASLATAKILELGCASGGNILPFALKYPDSHTIGIDLSNDLIAFGNEMKLSLNLSNIDLICCDILDVDTSFGTFDYIIVHDVFSLVSNEVRIKILAICKENLNENGLAYISYNTLPGWNNLATIRDLALYHSNNFKEIPEKINQIRLLFDFVKEAVKESDSAYAKLMLETRELLNDKPDFSIAQDFLQTHNKAFYFSAFMEEATKVGLQYVVDAEITKMYIPNYSKIISEKLGGIEEVMRMEQYLDFITNRAFRQTILCHNHQLIQRKIPIDKLVDYYFKMNLVSPPEEEILAEELNQEAIFYLNNDPEDTVSTKNPMLKAVFKVLSENDGYLSFHDLVSLSANKLPEVNLSELEAQAKVSLMDLFLKGKIDIRADFMPINSYEMDTPKVWEYVAAQTLYLKQKVVTNLYFESIQLSLFEYYLVRYLDGNNTKEVVISKMLTHFKNGELISSYKGTKVTSDEKLRGIITLAYLDALEKFREHALLV
jgi:methyltransferase-like protein/cyclopropane fatty-acyl-phospholipid synthase-like methyltransferase